ncbi:MAG: multiple resistance and pH regulation protein F [Candidatus Omnitrophica bacterium]|nr:multiple resistance and pH regulation protein F [Candidatus Omnitrophota bacterium]
MKILRWIIGLFLITVFALLIIFYPLESLLKWQSECFSRCLFVLLLCFVFCLYRIFRGPTSADRAVCIDILGILIVGFCAFLSIPTGRDWYIDIAIAWALQSFIGTLALAKYLEGRHFDE